MRDDWSRYEALRDAGKPPHSAYRLSSADGLDAISSIRMLRQVFGLSLGGAKEVTLQATGEATSLDEHQARWVPHVEQALRSPDAEA